jgi:hypothetical protein
MAQRDDDAKQDKRVPTTAQLRRLTRHLDQIVTLTGPNCPPGYESSACAESWIQIEGWALGITQNIMMSVIGAELITTSPPHCNGKVYRVEGWLAGVDGALWRVRAITDRLLKTWGMIRWADLPPYPGMEKSGARAGNLPPTFALTITNEDHAGLVWALGRLVKASEWAEQQDQRAEVTTCHPAIEAALRIVARAPASIKLISFLSGQSGMQATLEEIAIALYAPSASNKEREDAEKAARQAYYRTRKRLEAAKAKAILTLNLNTVRIVLV